ncbi:hypothetical protein BDV38DRAFT_242785 [Aspergillus pseudotamarii]|uniref:Uncharacterized protein n=1 Tax=Aspergillus pseudotamarii TaxID=132259 RepID=A0A5N6SWP6_ASPPS|nr:uncharacterized protein BDV38DRAFT_242785 [Aspergillus pseudotamarii]KAE8139106.1 hypothetical protein BDV38DRAFT_242785 [Aspergillus pseudotamarii]
MNPPKTPPQTNPHPKFLASTPFKPKESTFSPPTTPETHRDNLSDILSDSDISILDLGPSISARNTSCYQASSTTKALALDAKQASSLTTPTTGHGYLQNDLTMDQGLKTRPTATSPPMKDTTQGADITPKKLMVRVGSVRGALRTFSSPLLSPLRSGTGKVGRPGVNRAKTSFRGVGGVLER